MLSFIDRHFPLVFVGSIVAPITVGLILNACSTGDKAEADATYSNELNEEIVTVRPRPGVECYVLRGRSSTNPRSMSCVTLPAPE